MGDTTAADWERLCTLVDDDPELTPSVLAAHAEGDDPWLALIDGLDECGALAYLEASDGGIQLADALPALPRIFGAAVDLEDVGEADTLWAAVSRANALLAPRGLQLVQLEEEPDAAPLVAVHVAAVAEIVTVAKRLGRKVRTA